MTRFKYITACGCKGLSQGRNGGVSVFWGRYCILFVSCVLRALHLICGRCECYKGVVSVKGAYTE